MKESLTSSTSPATTLTIYQRATLSSAPPELKIDALKKLPPKPPALPPEL
jgi:hypothetical protein